MSEWPLAEREKQPEIVVEQGVKPAPKPPMRRLADVIPVGKRPTCAFCRKPLTPWTAQWWLKKWLGGSGEPNPAPPEGAKDGERTIVAYIDSSKHDDAVAYWDGTYRGYGTRVENGKAVDGVPVCCSTKCCINFTTIAYAAGMRRKKP